MRQMRHGPKSFEFALDQKACSREQRMRILKAGVCSTSVSRKRLAGSDVLRVVLSGHWLTRYKGDKTAALYTWYISVKSGLRMLETGRGLSPPSVPCVGQSSDASTSAASPDMFPASRVEENITPASKRPRSSEFRKKFSKSTQLRVLRAETQTKISCHNPLFPLPRGNFFVSVPGNHLPDPGFHAIRNRTGEQRSPRSTKLPTAITYWSLIRQFFAKTTRMPPAAQCTPGQTTRYIYILITL
jgi:hypothetical protein